MNQDKNSCGIVIGSTWAEFKTGRKFKVIELWIKDMGGSWAIKPDRPMADIQYLDNGEKRTFDLGDIEQIGTLETVFG